MNSVLVPQSGIYSRLPAEDLLARGVRVSFVIALLLLALMLFNDLRGDEIRLFFAVCPLVRGYCMSFVAERGWLFTDVFPRPLAPIGLLAPVIGLGCLSRLDLGNKQCGNIY